MTTETKPPCPDCGKPLMASGHFSGGVTVYCSGSVIHPSKCKFERSLSSFDVMSLVAAADRKGPAVKTETKSVPPAAQATDEQIFAWEAGGEGTDKWLPQEWIFRLLARIEADRALILPSSCSASHPEIRYQGETCPLCEARMEIAELKQNRSYANDQFNDLRDEINRLEDLILKLDWEPSEDQLEYHLSLEADAITARRAALSRPSSDSGAKPKCLPHGQGRIGCWQEQLIGGEWVTNHSVACPTLKPGAGEKCESGFAWFNGEIDKDLLQRAIKEGKVSLPPGASEAGK